MYGTVEYKLNISLAMNTIDSNNTYPQERMFMALLESADKQIAVLKDRISKMESADILLTENTRIKQELERYKTVNKVLMEKLEQQSK